MAPTGQVAAHVPHPLHNAELIEDFLTVIVSSSNSFSISINSIALYGHTSLHFPHPMHFSV